MALVISCSTLLRREGWRLVVWTRSQDVAWRWWLLGWGAWLSRKTPGLPLCQWGMRNSSSGSWEAEAIFCVELACSLDGTCRQPLGCSRLGLYKHLCLKNTKLKTKLKKSINHCTENSFVSSKATEVYYVAFCFMGSSCLICSTNANQTCSQSWDTRNVLHSLMSNAVAIFQWSSNWSFSSVQFNDLVGIKYISHLYSS